MVRHQVEIDRPDLVGRTHQILLEIPAQVAHDHCPELAEGDVRADRPRIFGPDFLLPLDRLLRLEVGAQRVGCEERRAELAPGR